jgi:hypothetical protein
VSMTAANRIVGFEISALTREYAYSELANLGQEYCELHRMCICGDRSSGLMGFALSA